VLRPTPRQSSILAVVACGVLPAISETLIPNDAGAILPLEVGVLMIVVVCCQRRTAVAATLATLLGHQLHALAIPSVHHHGLWIASVHIGAAWLAGAITARQLRRNIFVIRRRLPRETRWHYLGLVSGLALLQSMILADHQTRLGAGVLSSLLISQWIITASTCFVMQRATLALLSRPRAAWDLRERAVAAATLTSMSLFVVLIAISLGSTRASRCDGLEDLLTFASSQLQSQLEQSRYSLEFARLLVESGSSEPSAFSQELEALRLRELSWLSSLYWVDLRSPGQATLGLGFPAERVFHQLGQTAPQEWSPLLQTTPGSEDIRSWTYAGPAQQPRLLLALATQGPAGAILASINLNTFLTAFKTQAAALQDGARLELHRSLATTAMVDLGHSPRTTDRIRSMRTLQMGDLEFELRASTEPYPQQSWSQYNPSWQLASLLLVSALLTQLGAVQRRRRLDSLRQHRQRVRNLHQTKLLHAQLLASERHLGFEGVLSTISHELATPLGIAQLALDDLRTLDDQPQAATRLAQSEDDHGRRAPTLRRMQQALSQARSLLRKYRLHSNTKSQVATRLVNLNQLLSEFVELMQPHCAQYGVGLELYGATGMVHILSKPSLINQVCMAIVNNALDHAFGDNRPDKTIRLELRSFVDYNLITIRDNGSGLPTHMENILFDPFTTGTSKAGHRGLGLYIARTIVENELHGSIRAVSSASGTAIQIELPAYSEASSDAHIVS
jgi:signal transduction histidine kinase